MPEEECPFCKIASGATPAAKVYEDESFLAFLDINPRNPGHALVIPKKHIETILDISDDEAEELFGVVKKVAAAVKTGTNADGLSISQSNGKAAGQLVPHLHFHVIPRFLAEGPIGLESVLPVKKLDKESTEKILKNIKSALEGKAPAAEARAEEAEPEEREEEGEEELSFDF